MLTIKTKVKKKIEKINRKNNELKKRNKNYF